MSKTLNQLKALILCGLAVVALQAFAMLRNGTFSEFNVFNCLVGMAIIILISLASLKIKEHIPFKIPAFAWASLLALLVTAPFSPIQGFILKYCNTVAFGQVSTMIMAVAGISMGARLGELVKLSWKIVLVAIVVFCGTFFGSALVAQLVLHLQGII